MEHGWQQHTHTQEKCGRPWRFSLVLDAQCQIERVRIVPSKSSFVFDLDGSLLHKGFSFCVMPSPFYCFLDGSVVDIYFSCCVSTPSSAKLYDYRLRAILRLPSINPTYPFLSYENFCFDCQADHIYFPVDMRCRYE
jgi:hypothetical protein